MLKMFARCWRVLPVVALSAFMLVVMAVPAFAQSAETLTGPLKAGAADALTAGFAVAAVLLVGFLIYKAVRRFTSA